MKKKRTIVYMTSFRIDCIIFVCLVILTGYVIKKFDKAVTVPEKELQNNTSMYASSLPQYLILLKDYKEFDTHAYDKTIHHINRFMSYFYKQDLKKMKKHFEYVNEYINRIRIHTNTHRHINLQHIINNIYRLLTQHMYFMYNKKGVIYNDIKTTNEYFLTYINTKDDSTTV